MSQHVPVQLDAMVLQAVNGESTFISTSAVTSAVCNVISWLVSKTSFTARKSSQALAEWICATHKSTASALSAAENRFRPKTRLGSPLAATISAIFRRIYSARHGSDDSS